MNCGVALMHCSIVFNLKRTAALIGAKPISIFKPHPRQWFFVTCIALLGRSNLYAQSPNSVESEPLAQRVELQEVTILGKPVTSNRFSVLDDLGASVYHFKAEDIDRLPKGGETPLNEVLQSAPGVVGDSSGQIHIRGEHANVQYRLNGLMLPQGLSGFGQSLDARFAKSIDMIDGALPAQYGLHTAGVVDFVSQKSFSESARLSTSVGSLNTVNTSAQYSGSKGDWSYFFNGTYSTNHQGIENPMPTATPLHDVTHQGKGFAHASYALEEGRSMSFTLGSYNGSFQIPNIPSQLPAPANPYFALATAQVVNPYAPTISGIKTPNPSSVNSSLINDQQFELNRFVAMSFNDRLTEDLGYQVSVYQNQSTLHYVPDVDANLNFNAVGSNVQKHSLTKGVQGDLSWDPSDEHALKFGWIANAEDVSTLNHSMVFNLDPLSGNVLGAPFALDDNSSKRGLKTLGVYIQDDWTLSSKLNVNYGLRFDAFSAFVSDHQWSPRLNAVYKAPDHWTLHAGYAHYFTPPPNEWVSVTSQSTFSGTTNAIPGLNSSIKAESADYVDVGVLKEFSSVYAMGLDAYYKKTRNTLDEGQFGPALIMTPYNYAQGRIYGIEWTNNWVKGAFQGYANAALNVSQARDIISGQYLFDQATFQYAQNNWINVDHAQSRTFSMGASYSTGGTRLNVNALMGTGLRDGFANTGQLPSFAVVNVGVSRTQDVAQMGPILWRLSVNNLFDRSYLIRDGSGIGVFAPQYGARRGFLLSAVKNF